MPPSPSTPLLVIVTGAPGSGKTALSARLAALLRLPLINRDGFKETLFDTLGWSDLAWSRRLGNASYGLLYHTLSRMLAGGCSCIVESNFDTGYDTPQFQELQRRYPFQPCQVVCHAEPAVLLERLRRRVESGERHPGHVDQEGVPKLAVAEIVGRVAPLNIGGAVLYVDTNDFAAIDYVTLAAQIRGS